MVSRMGRLSKPPPTGKKMPGKDRRTDGSDKGFQRRALAVKLRPPSMGPRYMPRPRLSDKVENSDSFRLALISAPAGSGKTTMLSDVISGADLFLGLAGPGLITVDDLKKMAKDPIVFAMANPDPEIMPEEAAPYVRIMATGRSDYPNQINNVLCFPGIFRGALDARAQAITEEMKTAAARAIARIIPESELREDYIVPSVFNRDVSPAVAAAVAEQAKEQGAAMAAGDTIGFAAVDAERIRSG